MRFFWIKNQNKSVVAFHDKWYSGACQLNYLSIIPLGYFPLRAGISFR